MEYGAAPAVTTTPQPLPARLAPYMPQTPNAQSYPDLPIINLPPGKLLITEQAAIVSTILGSCVSLCLHSKKFRIGAICHGMLPRQIRPPTSGHFPYLDTVVPHMIKTMTSRFGLTPSALTVKMFGGANVIQTGLPVPEGLAIGQQNIAAALESLAQFGIVPSVQETGGTQGYKIFFNTETGEVFVRRIAPNLAKSFAHAMQKQSASDLKILPTPS